VGGGAVVAKPFSTGASPVGYDVREEGGGE